MANRLPNLIILTIGIVLLLATGWRSWRMANFLSTATRTTGVVLVASPHPTIRFSTEDGRRIEFIQNGFVSRPEGAAIPVAYQPADPQKTALAKTFWTTWGAALWTLPAALGFTLLPLFGGLFSLGRR